ncbi:unnamed protein product [Owenia fusiformis]|uniref:NAD(P)H oxidase (H2O2-forming) n=1 Tax=Owenia fusiformis TaxID=6347 RepID=A0A8S4Q136_OWEFU|nr:unnamed protein product [Owenia fusiformis]
MKLIFSLLLAWCPYIQSQSTADSHVNITTAVPLTTDSPTTNGSTYETERHVEYMPYDGWYNNRAHPELGAVDSPLVRLLPSAYEDGVYEPSGKNRPNPFEISDALMSGETGHPSSRNRTAFMVFFGQQVVEEILDAQGSGCPVEYFNIKIPRNHRYNPDDRDDIEMPFLRTRYDMRTGFSPNNPRQQLNEITPYIDGGLMYGVSKAWADALRVTKNGNLAPRGRLAAANDTDPNEGNYPEYNTIRLPMANPPPPADHVLKPIKRFFKLGNPRGNENAFLLTFGILWFRYHNYLTHQLDAVHPDWSDERIYNEARKWTVAAHQKIVMYDWLPSWLGTEEDGSAFTLPPYTHYKPAVDPGITHVFQSAAMRFGHTLVPPGVYRRNKTCHFRYTTTMTGEEGHHALRTCNSYWNPQDAVKEQDIDELLMGMASQITEREDNIITPDLRGDVFGPLEFSRRDLMAINIQRGRDHGLPDYNTARRELGLDTINDVRDINPELFKSEEGKELLENIWNLYNESGIDNMDIWAGGILETTSSGPGDLFRTIIADQFQRVRDGDRFWYENDKNGLFTPEEIQQINKTTLYDIIQLVTDIGPNDIQKNPFFWNTGDPCEQPRQLNHSELAECEGPKHFDYFVGSELSFILTFTALGIFFIGCIVVLWLLGKHKERMQREERRAAAQKRNRRDMGDVFSVMEYVSKKEGYRYSLLKMDSTRHTIQIMTEAGKQLRSIDLQNIQTVFIRTSIDKGKKLCLIRVPKEYDVLMKFSNLNNRDQIIGKIETFLGGLGVAHKRSEDKESVIMKDVVTKDNRQKLVEKFFRVVFAQAFKIKDENRDDVTSLDAKAAKDVIDCELTKSEFAEALSMKASSTFIEQMFSLVDKDNNGYISFREFLDMIVIFAKGDPEAKAKLLFDMYDIDQTGKLDREEFKRMLRSLMELANEKVTEDQMDTLLNSMYTSAGLANKESITLKEFNTILGDYKEELGHAQLKWDGANVGKDLPKRENAPSRARKTLVRAFSSPGNDNINKRISNVAVNTVKRKPVSKTENPVMEKFTEFKRYIENYRAHIFWLSLYTLVTIGVFAERAYYYSVEREHAGLRTIAGYGVTVTRGAASGMMFTFTCLLVTMCRNTITYLRETFLHRFIPFDAAISMHKYIAMWALFFTVMHCIGHAFNFYHIATQTANDLTCIFRDYFHATDELPKFHYWCWQTVTGVTGVLVTLLVIMIYVFATQYARRNAFKVFWFIHNLYPVMYILMFMHGSGMLVQPAFFHYFFLGPAILFTLDKLVSVSRNRVEISVVRAELLPSEVTHLEFKKPLNFEYKSGQWVRIASLAQNGSEYHPFTLTSAPHEETLSVHVRSVGPWTSNLRQTYDPSKLLDSPYPKLFLDGPFGEGHQDWYKFDIAVLVGGGIGVTPFASILKDLVEKSRKNVKFNCKKVYFLWVTRTQKQFEWLTDIIREVEDNDQRNLVSVHIFVTQFYHKFDLRTTMLYICERHFQKISNQSLFTGLRSITHFGRPDFHSFLNSLQDEHLDISKIGVFSCGPPPMTHKVEEACSQLNKCDGASYQHHYENF